MSPYIVQLLFLIAGFVSILAAVLDWNWFFNSQNARFFVQNLGRKHARLFYGVLGLILIIMSVILMISTTKV
ncbi:hypothetical protein FQ707_08725 [Bacteroidaceae bacterium HV4-6-C5C]|nr:hypothetical protein FQ707_08725 [Bacteroidaceae bacterium HV4-6-C5C]